MHRLRTNLWSVAGFAALLGCIMSWSLAMPVGSAPDEPAHVFRAASLWKGQFLSEQQAPDGSWLVEVPNETAAAMRAAECTKFHAEVPATCPNSPSPSNGSSTVATGAGRYVPIYYYAVGWPSLIDAGGPGVIGMRMMSALVCSLMVFWAMRLMRRLFAPRFTPAIVFVILTPQFLWLSSVVNPNSWELSAGLLVWAAGLVHVTTADINIDRRPRVNSAFVIGAICLLSMRRLGPLWLTLIVGSLALAWGCLPRDRRAPALVHRRTVVLHVPWMLGLCAASAYWHQVVELGPALSALTPDPEVQNASMIARAQALLPDLWQWTRQFYGVTGWLDTRSPVVAMLTWTLAVAFICVVAGRFCVHRLMLGALVTAGLVGTYLIPASVAAVMGPTVGLHVWQGRYQMPYSQGLLLALAVIATVSGAGRFSSTGRSRPALAAGAVLAAMATATFSTALHRYSDGEGKPWDLMDPSWSPPLGVVATLAVAWLLTSLLVLAIVKGGLSQSERHGGDIRVGDGPESSQLLRTAWAGASNG